MSKQNTVVVIGGPTGVGKSELAFHVAKALGGELISCDSVQVFKGLHIGANKTPLEYPGREHLLDLLSWREAYTAADFYIACRDKIEDILNRDKVPILVGGTGFYLDWILRGRPSAPQTDAAVLESVETEIAQDQGDWNVSIKRLEAVDPEYARLLLPNDYYRLKRALSVFRATNTPLSEYKTRSQIPDYDFRCFFITADREYICRNIDARCEEMLVRGLFEEVSELRREGLTTQCQAGRSIGYFETLNLLDSCVGKDVAEVRIKFLDYLEEFKSATRQYSRKQENWFARKAEFKWVVRDSPFQSIDPLNSRLFSFITNAIKVSRNQFDSTTGFVAVEDAKARALTTDSVRKRMKIYRSASTRFSGSALDEIIRKLMNCL